MPTLPVEPVARVEPFDTPEPVATDPEDNVGPLPSAAQVQPPALTYDREATRGGAVTRRQFRFLLILTLVNTLMLGLFVAGPGLSKMTGGWWNSYKQWRDDRAKAKQAKASRDKFLANYQQLLTLSAPPDNIAYDEDQERAAGLIAAGRHVAFQTASNPVYLTPKPWQSPAVVRAPAALQSISIGRSIPGAPLYVGGRKTPSGEDRLVWVGLIVDQNWRNTNDTQSQRQYHVQTRRILRAGAYKPDPADTRLESSAAASRNLEILQPSHKDTRILWNKTTSWENGQVQIFHRHLMRFFAGQADATDPSRFTIRYDLDGQAGVIDGQLNDDETVTLMPREGRIVNSDPSGRTRSWDPQAEPAPK